MNDEWVDIPSPTKEEQDEWVDIPSRGSAFGKGVAQGITFGFSDEIVGGAGAAADVAKDIYKNRDISSAFGKFSDFYEQRRDESRQRLQQARQEHPAATLAGDITGSILPTALTLGKAGPATGAGVIARAAATGAAAGGLRSAGEQSEGIDLAQAGKDAAFSGAVGGALGGASVGLRKILDTDAVTNFLFKKEALSPASQKIIRKVAEGKNISEGRVVRGSFEQSQNKDMVSRIDKALETAKNKKMDTSNMLINVLKEAEKKPIAIKNLNLESVGTGAIETFLYSVPVFTALRSIKNTIQANPKVASALIDVLPQKLPKITPFSAGSGAQLATSKTIQDQEAKFALDLNEKIDSAKNEISRLESNNWQTMSIEDSDSAFANSPVGAGYTGEQVFEKAYQITTQQNKLKVNQALDVWLNQLSKLKQGDSSRLKMQDAITANLMKKLNKLEGN